MAHSGGSSEDLCCYCNVFGVRTTVNKPGSESCDCAYCFSQLKKVWEARQKRFPVPALSRPAVRWGGIGLFVLFGILGVAGIFITLSVSFIGRYPGPGMCLGRYEYNYEYDCPYSLVNTSSVHTVHDKLFIITGVALLVLNIGGIIATMLQSRRGLKLVGMLLLVFFWVQVIHSAVMGGMVYHGQVQYPPEVKKEAHDSMLKNLKDKYKEQKQTWDVAQKSRLECCGVDDYKDYVKLGREIPKSCMCGSSQYSYNSRYNRYDRHREASRGCEFYFETTTNKTIEVKQFGCIQKLMGNAHWNYQRSQEMLWRSNLGLVFLQSIPIIFALVLGFFKRSDEVEYKRVDLNQQQHTLDNLPMLPSADYSDKAAPSVVNVEHMEEHTSVVSEANSSSV